MNKTLASIAALVIAAGATAATAQELTFENADTDGSGSVSYTEFQSLQPAVTEQDFAAADGDGSGELSMAEFDTLVLALGAGADTQDDDQDKPL